MARPFTDQALWACVVRHARCADGTPDPEQWFPVNAEIEKAWQEAAAAMAVCTGCPVRAQCLALWLRHWGIGQHGVWGGLVAAERAALRPIVRAHGPPRPHLLLTPGADPGAATIAGGLFGARSDDGVLAVLPFFHVFGLSSVINVFVRYGGCLSILPRFQ